MSGYRIIDHGRDVLPGQVFIQSIAVDPFQDDRVMMKNVMTVGSTVGRRDLRMSQFKSVVVIIGGGTPGSDISIQALQFHIQNGCLDRIQPAVTTYEIMIITPALPMIGNHFQPAS